MKRRTSRKQLKLIVSDRMLLLAIAKHKAFQFLTPSKKLKEIMMYKGGTIINYETVKLTTGHDPLSPYCVCRYYGWELAKGDYTYTFGDQSTFNVKDGMIIALHGYPVEHGLLTFSQLKRLNYLEFINK